jgi:hypothetical protein
MVPVRGGQEKMWIPSNGTSNGIMLGIKKLSTMITIVQQFLNSLIKSTPSVLLCVQIFGVWHECGQDKKAHQDTCTHSNIDRTHTHTHTHTHTQTN